LLLLLLLMCCLLRVLLMDCLLLLLLLLLLLENELVAYLLRDLSEMEGTSLQCLLLLGERVGCVNELLLVSAGTSWTESDRRLRYGRVWLGLLLLLLLLLLYVSLELSVLLSEAIELLLQLHQSLLQLLLLTLRLFQPLNHFESAGLLIIERLRWR